MNEPGDFVTVAFLYKRTSRAGKTLYFGELGKTRLYLFATEPRAPKDCRPEFSLCIRREDWKPGMEIKDMAQSATPKAQHD